MRSLSERLDLCSINTATLGHQAPIESVIDDVARFGFGGLCPWRRDLEGKDVSAIARRIRALRRAVELLDLAICVPYFFLPCLRKMNSSTYFTPFPL